jgi:hypothetical protein
MKTTAKLKRGTPTMNEDEIISELRKAGVPTHVEGNRVEIELSDQGKVIIPREQVFKLQALLKSLTKPVPPPKFKKRKRRSPRGARRGSTIVQSAKIPKRKLHHHDIWDYDLGGARRGSEIVQSAKIPVGSAESPRRGLPRTGRPAGRGRKRIRTFQGGLPGLGRR